MKTALAVAALQLSAVHGYAGRRRHGPSPSPAAAPNKTVTTYHLFEPKYTGLANKDAGDFLGDASFIFMTFNKMEVDNPEADIQDNVIEMSTVTVKEWSRSYLKCNAPGAVYNGSHGQAMDCPKDSVDYCCIDSTNQPAQLTADTPAAYEMGRSTGGGYWFSFPKASEGTMWTEKVERRIQGSCVGNAWREEAGGCSQCGSDLDQCVAKCIQDALVTTSGYYEKDYSKLRPAWDRTFSNKTLCPDQPLPKAAAIIV